MRFLSCLMKVVTNWNDLFGDGGALSDGKWTWVSSLMDVLSTVLWVLLALVGAAGGIYAIYVGIKMARADSAEQREENKKRLINIIVSIVVVIVLIIFFNLFLPMLLDAFGVFKKATDPDNKWEDDGGSGGSAVATIVNTARCLLRF